MIDLYQDHDYYGLVLISAREVKFYLANDSLIKLVRKEELHLGTKHNKGGQSSARFGRAHENKRHRHHQLIANWLLEEYYNHQENKLQVIGLIIGGPAETKEQVIRTEIFQKYFSENLIYSGNTHVLQDGVAEELYRVAKDQMNHHKMTREKKILEDLWQIRDTNPDLLVFGVSETIQGLSECMLKKVIYRDNLEEIENLGKEYGCELVKIQSMTIQSELEGYGGCIGVKWY